MVISKVVWEDVWDLKTLHRGIITHTGMMEEKDHDSHRFGIYGEVKKKTHPHYHTFGEHLFALGIDCFPFSSPLSLTHTRTTYTHNIEKET